MIAFGIVFAWVLIFLVNHNPAIFSVLLGTEKCNGPRQTASPDNTIYTDLETACKRVLIPSYLIQVI